MFRKKKLRARCNVRKLTKNTGTKKKYGILQSRTFCKKKKKVDRGQELWLKNTVSTENTKQWVGSMRGGGGEAMGSYRKLIHVTGIKTTEMLDMKFRGCYFEIGG